jgi:choline kinase
MKRTSSAVILVAGIGSRLRPLTDERPKALVEVRGESLLSRALGLLSRHGVQKFVLATGYREDAVRALLAGSGLDVRYCYNAAYDRTQNSVSLGLCRDALGTDGFFKLDGDLLFEPEVLERLDASAAPLAVAVDSLHRVDSEAMKVRVGSDRRIVAFGKAIPIHESAGESIGIERLLPQASGRLFEALEVLVAAGEHGLYYEDVYSRLIADRAFDAEAVEVGDLPWTEIDDHADLERARDLVIRMSRGA